MMLNKSPATQSIIRLLRGKRPNAVAHVVGSPKFPGVRGTVCFWKKENGTVVVADISGLPDPGQGACGAGVFAMHIHEGNRCAGNESDPFAMTGGHFNPGGCMHPNHAGDLPPLFSNLGRAWYAVLTDRFSAGEIIGKTVIIHHNPDDFTTQPSGNAGEKIACGVIRRMLI